MQNISFKANIKIDYQKLNEGLAFDSYFFGENKKNIKRIIKQVEALSEMKQKSSVSITPRLDHNQLNLITRVEDKKGIVQHVVTERSARKMVDDNDFARRFISNIKQAIINVDITRKELKKIKKSMNRLKSIKDEGFILNLPTYFLASLNKGNNPTQRIIELLEKIDKTNPDELKSVSIKTMKKRSEFLHTSKVMSYFCVKTKSGEKLLQIQHLMKDPSDNLFV